MSLIKDYLHHKSNMERLEVLIAREQLMEDIECIIESRIDGDCDGLIEALCAAVCINFPSKGDM